MENLVLKATKRETGKFATKQVRYSDLVPGVYYTKGEDSIPIATQPLDLRPLVYTNITRVVELMIEGEDAPKRCVLKDVDFDPVTERITHFDLLGVKDGQKITVTVPFMLKGQSVGVRSGGILQHVLKKIKITCLPEFLPDKFEIDITPLKVGDSINLGDLKLENVEYHIPDTTLIVAVIKSRLSQSLEGQKK